ncbi:hypothetical protein MMC10_002862 [Thelotrema lepadinum]|nr:hypothetical protein [Thelotrema lepadinum]
MDLPTTAYSKVIFYMLPKAFTKRKAPTIEPARTQNTLATWTLHDDHGLSKSGGSPLRLESLVIQEQDPRRYGADRETQLYENDIPSLDLSHPLPLRPTVPESILPKPLEVPDYLLWQIQSSRDLTRWMLMHDARVDTTEDTYDLDIPDSTESTREQDSDDILAGEVSNTYDRRGVLNKARKCIGQACAQIGLLKKDGPVAKNKFEMKDRPRVTLHSSTANLPVSYGFRIKSSTNIHEASKDLAKDSLTSQTSWNPTRSFQKIFGDKQTSKTSKESQKPMEDRKNSFHDLGDFTHNTGNFKEPSDQIWPGNSKYVWDWVPSSNDHLKFRGNSLPSMPSIHSEAHQSGSISSSSDSAPKPGRDRLEAGPRFSFRAQPQ